MRTHVMGPVPLGMNNRAADHALPKRTDQDFVYYDAARNIVNCDVDETGRTRRRKGFTKVYDGLATQGAFSCPAGVFFVEGTTLKQLNADNTATTLLSGVFGSVRTFDYFNGTVYFSDGLVCKKIVNSVVLTWGMSRPSAPTLATSAGSFGGGVYLAAYCWADAQGVESGASPITSVTANDNSGIVFNNLPVPSDPQAVALRIYLSTANGQELYHVADTTAASYSVLSGRFDDGVLLETMGVEPPPPGRIIRFYNGRAYVADAVGNVWYSDPYASDHFRLGEGFLQFPEPVDIMEPVTSGIFFAYGKETAFHQGSPEDGFQVRRLFDYGGVYGSGCRILNSPNVVWQSQRGMIIGAPDGRAENVQEKHVAVESAESGATLVREQDGMRQYIASIHQPTTSRLMAKSFIDAEVIRRGA